MPICYHENLFIIDFDDVDLYDTWLSLQIKTKTVKTCKGYHVYLKGSSLRHHEYFNTGQYDLLNTTHIAPLPPSMHFKNAQKGVDSYIYYGGKRYEWEDLESDIQEYDQRQFFPPFMEKHWNDEHQRIELLKKLKKIKLI